MARQELLADVVREMPAHAASAVRLNIAISQQVGLPLTDMQCLGLLAEGPSAPGALADRLGLTTGAMTKVLDRLARDGYVSRAADPVDRRRVVIEAEPGRLAELAETFESMGGRMRDHLAGYSAEELRTVLDFIRAGVEATNAEIAEIRRHGVKHARRRVRGS